ncbi:unnamed protein product, partial [Didymodactylos carnosus]
HLHHLMNDSTKNLEKCRTEMIHSMNEIDRLTIELDSGIKARLKVEHEKCTLKEKILFLSTIHKEEINELKLLSSIHIDIDLTTFYKNELKDATRKIRDDFNKLAHFQQNQLKNYYSIKVEELVQQSQQQQKQIKDETKNSNKSIITMKETITERRKQLNILENENKNSLARINELEIIFQSLKQQNTDEINQHERELDKLRRTLTSLTTSNDEIKCNKTTLEYEINIYRRLLEIHDTNTQTTIQTYRHVKSIPIIRIDDSDIVQYSESESHYIIKFQRTSKGSITIDECSLYGKYIQLANTSNTKDISLSNWQILRIIDHQQEIIYSLPKYFVLKYGKKVKIYARIQDNDSLPNDLVNITIDSWGLGSHIITRLLDEKNDERATHVQKCIYP